MCRISACGGMALSLQAGACSCRTAAVETDPSERPQPAPTAVGTARPQPDQRAGDPSVLACKCALKQLEVLNRMNEAWPPEKRLSIGIGINTGIMTVGNMGSLGRMNYTLMGDMVNLGARLEGTNKEYFTRIIISEFTYAQVKDKVVVRELDNIRVKGKNKPVLIYELVDVIEGLEPPAKEPVKGRAGARA